VLPQAVIAASVSAARTAHLLTIVYPCKSLVATVTTVVTFVLISQLVDRPLRPPSGMVRHKPPVAVFNATPIARLSARPVEKLRDEAQRNGNLNWCSPRDPLRLHQDSVRGGPGWASPPAADMIQAEPQTTKQCL